MGDALAILTGGVVLFSISGYTFSLGDCAHKPLALFNIPIVGIDILIVEGFKELALGVEMEILVALVELVVLGKILNLLFVQLLAEHRHWIDFVLFHFLYYFKI